MNKEDLKLLNENELISYAKSYIHLREIAKRIGETHIGNSQVGEFELVKEELNRRGISLGV